MLPYACRRLSLALTSVVILSISCLSQTPTSPTYTDVASWSAAVSASGAATNSINLQALPAGVTLYNTIPFNNTGAETGILGPDDGHGRTMVFNFSSPITAFGASLSEYNYSGFPYVVSLSDGEVFTLPYTGTTTFFGFVANTPISSIVIGEQVPYWATDYVQINAVQISTIRYNSFALPTQDMEGALQLNPGDTLSVGYDFTMPGSHPATTLRYAQGQVSFAYACASGASGGTLNVPYPSASYSVPQNGGGWSPSGNQQDASVYQGQLTVPDLCGGTPILFQQGGTFSGGTCSNNPSSNVNMRWHYSGAGSSGSWSGTKTISPSSCQ